MHDLAMYAKLQILGVGTKSQTVNNEALALSFQKLNVEQAAAVIAMTQLDAITVEATLKKAGFNKEQIYEIMLTAASTQQKNANAAATGAQSVATQGATASTLGFNAALKGLWTTMKMHPIMTIISVMSLLWPVISKISDYLIVTAEEARSAFADSSSELQQAESDIESLKNELSSLKQRLDELDRIAKMGSLTPNQELERQEIQKTIDKLNEELLIQEKLAEYRRQQASANAADAMKKTTYAVGTGQITTLDDGTQIVDGGFFGGADAIIYYTEQLKILGEQRDDIKQKMSGLADGDPLIESYNDQLTTISKTIVAYQSELSRIVPEQQEYAGAIQDTSGPIFDLQQYTLAAIEIWKEFVSATGDATDSLDSVATISRRIFPEISSHIKSLTNVESDITKLRDALADFRDDGYVTMDAFSDMAETFGKFPDEFERFMVVASNSKSSMSEVQQAASELATAYLKSSDFLSNMTDGTIDLTIATLKNIGVANAEEVVAERLAIAKAAAALEEAKLTEATWEQIESHFKSADAAEVDAKALYALYVEQLNARIAAIDFKNATGDVIESLYKEAKAANITGEAFEALGKIQRLQHRASIGQLDEYEANNFGDLMDLYESQLNAALDDFKIELDFGTDITPTVGNGKTAAEKAAEEAREAFEKVYNAKKHELDMEKITIEEFYAWLDGEHGYKDYFKEQGETLSDFQKYSKEVFDGLREVHQTYLDVFDYEISVIERAENSENELIAKYNQKRASVNELIKELRKYLELQGMTEVEIISNDQYRTYLEMLYTIEDEITSIQDEVYEKQSGYVNDLIDLTEEYIRQVKEDEIDALEETKNAFSDLVSLQKELINGAREEEQYERQKNEKLKEMQKLQERISALELDDSRSAALEKGKLLEELNALQIELNDLQTEHYIDSVETSLDKEEQEFEKAQDAKIKEIEDFLDDNAAVNRAALNELDKMNQDLFDRLESYASHYTDTTRDELLKMWEEVTAAAEKYGSVTNAASVYEDSDVNNAVKTQLDRMRRNGQEYGSASDSRKEWLANDSAAAGAELERLLGVPVRRDENGVWWIGSGTSRKKLFDVYHSGTPSVGGHATFKQNETFALLENGESVFTKKQVNALWDILSKFNPSNLLGATTIIPKLYGTSSQAQTTQTNIEVSMPLTLYGTMDDSVMEVLGRHGREVANLVASKILK